MLFAVIPGEPRHAVRPGEALPNGWVWLDLLCPSDDERALAESATGLRVPRREEILEIETSSRLRLEGQGIYLSLPVAARDPAGGRKKTAVGLVLAQHAMMTLRYADLPALVQFGETLPTTSAAQGATGVLTGLLEALVDRLADLLEQVDGELEQVSRDIFHLESPRGRRRREDLMLRATLARIGRAGDLVSDLRASLLGMGRIVPYMAEAAAAWLPAELKPRITSIRQDVLSLSDFDAQLMNKVQFLLDATLGLLNLEQNDGLKVLTVVSVVGIPPTLVASLYGMNFEHMPELHWAWGYPYGLGLIALSILLPLVWFRIKGWV